jgi:NAD(P)-dependent dehydrogenase (short-subunit alcohol dehydrogenase family)
VATPEGGASLTETALAQWGRLDAVVSNATIVRHMPFEDMTVDDIDAVLDVKLRGAMFVLQPAYKVMKASGGGRIVAVTSLAGLLGSANQANYAAANAGLLGLVRTLAREGAGYGIRANLLNPGAVNARAAGWRDQLGPSSGVFDRLTPQRVSPMVVVLTHRSCPCTAQIMCAWAGAFARATVTINHGWASSDDPTAEDVVEHWGEITSQDTAEDPEPDAFSYATANFQRLFGDTL